MRGLWKECVLWLESFHVLEREIETLEDFVTNLRDGVILCHLLHSVEEKSLELSRLIVSPLNEGSDFTFRHNIFLFLHSIISHFHLSMEEYFFEPDDLITGSNLSAVLKTLSALSHCSKFKRTHVPGWPKKEKNFERKLRTEESLYCSFGESYERENSTSYLHTQEKPEENESIYTTICSPKGQRFSLEIFGVSKKETKRSHPIKELIETEDKYLENLIMVRDTFRNALSSLTSSDKEIIFYKFDDLISLHSDLLLCLKVQKHYIGDIFIQFLSEISRHYGDYCVHLPVATEYLLSLTSRNIRVRTQLGLCQSKAKPSTFSLSSHLVLPFQRFLKYHLLLNEILKYTPPTHAEFPSLKKAVESLKEVGKEVNDRKRDHEESARLRIRDESDLFLLSNVQKNIKLMMLPNGASLSDFGRLKRVGDILSEGCSFKPFRISDYAFLFDTILLLCSKPKWLQHRYRFRTAIKLKDYIFKISNNEISHYTISCYHKSNSSTPHIYLISKNISERNEWMTSLMESLEIANPSENANNAHVLSLTTFPPFTPCFHCSKNLAGTLCQGYRCHRCGVSLHKPCIALTPCLNVGSLFKSVSVSLPTALSESLERSESSLSLAPIDCERNSALLFSLQKEEAETSYLRLEQAPWYAGTLTPTTAAFRLQSLPVGTFLIRKRANGSFALALKSHSGVKHMIIQNDEEDDDDDPNKEDSNDNNDSRKVEDYSDGKYNDNNDSRKVEDYSDGKYNGNNDNGKIEDNSDGNNNNNNGQNTTNKYDDKEPNRKKKETFYFSNVRKFSSLSQMIFYYRTRDLTDNFNYEDLRGVCLKCPFQDI